QLHVPMLIYWPGISPSVIHYFSTHYDVVPTLMREVFGVSNPAADYSIGQSMFIPDRSISTITGNYTNYAVLTHKRHTTFYPNGAYAIKTPMSQQFPQAQIDVPLIKKANKDLVRYYNH
ncbi:MAG: phosphoglycerol transferase, partial [Coxiellaceae bacterium]|nr:phosphoglycerol transferase [Coxiellaceae bacterium]